LGHPIACAAALEVQRVIEEDRLLDNVRRMGRILEERLRQRFGEHPHVGDIRGRGLFWALELVEDRPAKRPFSSESNVHAAVKKEAFRQGLICYPAGGTADGYSGDHVLIAPPYIIDETHVDEIVGILGEVLDNVL
jgi:adenosylmethionine-8-amino-7-oxononanoate aminotransferase